MKTITIKRRLAHPPQKVWQAFTDRDQLAEWLMPNDFEPKQGATFQFKTKPQGNFDGIVKCEVLEIKPNEKLVLSWNSGDLDSEVTVLISPQGEGTDLTLIHTGFTLATLAARIILSFGWKSLLSRKLPAFLEEQKSMVA